MCKKVEAMSAEQRQRLKDAGMAFASKHAKAAQLELVNDVFALWMRVLLEAKAERATMDDGTEELLRKRRQQQREKNLAFVSRLYNRGDAARAECFTVWAAWAKTSARESHLKEHRKLL